MSQFYFDDLLVALTSGPIEATKLLTMVGCAHTLAVGTPVINVRGGQKEGRACHADQTARNDRRRRQG